MDHKPNSGSCMPAPTLKCMNASQIGFECCFDSQPGIQHLLHLFLLLFFFTLICFESWRNAHERSCWLLPPLFSVSTKSQSSGMFWRACVLVIYMLWSTHNTHTHFVVIWGSSRTEQEQSNMLQYGMYYKAYYLALLDTILRTTHWICTIVVESNLWFLDIFPWWLSCMFSIAHGAHSKRNATQRDE